jgi:hypothetical protein
LPISAANTINLAFQHTKQQLFQPFRFGQWTRLAIVGLLAGELGSGGGNFNSTGHYTPGQTYGGGFPHIDLALLIPFITIFAVAGIFFLIMMTYISSVMRFVLFDSVLTRKCRIRAGWFGRQEPGWKYFLWQIGFAFFAFVGIIFLLGLPAAFAFGMGWFNPPRAHVPQLAVAGIFVLVLLVVYMVGVALVHVFTKDFVVPQMALEGIGAVEGWRRLLPMLEAEQKEYALYVLLKIVLSIAVAIMIGIVTLILALIIGIPVFGIVATAVIAAKSAGYTWNVFTITAAIVAGCTLLLLFFYLVSLISVPALVFFPAYSIYFFAGRYRPLTLALFPSASANSPPGFPPTRPAPLPAG